MDRLGRMQITRSFALVGLTSAALTLSACGDSTEAEPGGASAAQDLEVVVGFYPLEFVTSRIAGDMVTVETLTSPGVDPHDVELSPQKVADIQQADLVIYSSGLQAAVDDAVEGQAADHSFDVNEAADLMPADGEDHHEHADDDGHAEDDPHADETEGHAEGEEHGHEESHSTDDAHADEEGHSTGEETSDEEHAHGDTDPHFWLDPERMAAVTQAIADQLGQVDPDNASSYEANADDLVSELSALTQEYDTGLANCSQDVMVTTHAAFGYIAEPYGFEQVSVTGLEPDSEPSAARLADVSHVVEDNGASTVYSEVILGSKIAETVANETGAQVRVLDPIEGVTDSSPGEDYVEIMRANLDTLRQGQGCT